MQQSTFERIYDVVKQIPYGKVSVETGDAGYA